MASPYRLNRVTPNFVFVFAFIASALLFGFSLVAVTRLAQSQNFNLLQYELTTLLKAHGSVLKAGDLRTFADDSNLSEQAGKISIYNVRNRKNFEAVFGNPSAKLQCSQQTFFEYDVSLCRPTLLPWTYLSLLTALYVAIILSVMVALFVMNRALLASFKSFFENADMSFSEPLGFNEAWQFAGDMASKFKNLQAQSIEFGRNQAMAQLATQVAHDIRSPVMALQTVIKLSTTLPKEQNDMLSGVAARITSIAEDLLLSAKSPDYVCQKHEEPFDVVEELRWILEEKKLAFTDRTGIKFLLDVGALSQEFLLVEKTELSRALSNLINNSVEAIAGVGEVKLSLRVSRRELSISVSDTGGGMPDSILHRLGERGYSYGKAKSTSGAGLGVYHARVFVERHGGKFSALSKVGHGTIMTLSFLKNAAVTDGPDASQNETRLNLIQLKSI